jgi:hypothetical protein
MAGRVDVLQWVRARTVSGARPPFNLLEVAHQYTVPDELEFPRTVAQFNVYLRAAGHSAGPTAARVRVHRELRHSRWELLHDFVPPNLVLPFPETGTVVYEGPVHLPHVRLTGTGLYAISVYFRCADDADEPDAHWDRERTDWDPPDEPEWAFGAVDYFVVNRSSL